MTGPREIVIDVFAGGGGASLGIERALGVPVDLAINHDPEALMMHRANHPHTRHGCADVWSIDPQQATGGRPVGLAWFSPDCTHHSRAKGGKPVEKKIRSLAWVVVRWAKAVRPRVIVMENVCEFAGWGPLTKRNTPNKRKKGETYRLWCEQIRALGYVLSSRELRACDYGAPTIRKRLFVVARCDGQPVVWPEPTHAEPGNLFGLPPYRTAADCIDWSLPCASIFLNKEEAARLGVRRPLAEKTLARIARGIRKFVLETGHPFIIKFRLGATGHPITEPLHTITAGSYVKRPAGAGHALGLVTPYLYNLTHGGRLEPIDDPLRTVTTANRGEKALVVPCLVRCAHGEVSPSGQSRWGPGEHDIAKPLPTVTASKDFALAAATLVHVGYGERDGQMPRVPGLEKPLGTVVGTGKHALIGVHLMTNTSGHAGTAADSPVPTATTGDRQYAVAAFLSKFCGTSLGSELRDPVPTITGGGQHIGEVRAFLLKYYGKAVGQSCGGSLHTVTDKARFGLVTVAGEQYQIADIGLRMLTPRELARAQGFPDAYVLTGTKSSQVAKIGNSVCPPVAAVIVAANVKLQQWSAVATEKG